jgi:hypothetical protein
MSPGKRFFIRIMIDGHRIDVPGAWGVASLVVLAGILGLFILSLVRVWH